VSVTAEIIGTHPQPLRYYVRLAAGTFRTMLDIGMLALGTGMVGLAFAVALDALDLASIGLPLSTTSLLGSALVIGVLGAFSLGIASEGGYGAAESVSPYPSLEVAIGRVLGSVAVGALLLLAASRTTEFVSGFSLPLRAAHEMIRAAGSAGVLAVPFVAVPLSWGVRRAFEGTWIGRQLELPILYVVWTVAVLLIYTMPTA
jgi:hypothetical protein